MPLFLDGVSASSSFRFLCDGVAVVEAGVVGALLFLFPFPDALSRSNKPRAFPSLCGVGPIAVRRGSGEVDDCRLRLRWDGVRNVRTWDGDS